LREHGFACDAGVLYFVASRERVRIDFDADLVAATLEAAERFRQTAAGEAIPPPLEDSPKCPRCSLVGICIPDEIRFLGHAGTEPRPLFAALDRGLPLYVQSPRAWVRKDGETLVVEEEKVKKATARLAETSQVVLFGGAGISTPAVQECLRREIPVTFLSFGGWLMGHTVSSGHRNVATRTAQYRASFDPAACLRLARSLVAAKIANCRTLIRRNWKAGSDGEAETPPPELLHGLQDDIKRALKAPSLETLLGVEGTAASRYYRHFPAMLRRDPEGVSRFDFEGRNRRPPRDPVNAMLSFAYSMLVREWSTALSAVGLDPYRGFYHQPRFGRPALALDMMEPFRPLVADSVVLTAINNGELRPADFISAAGSCAMSDSGRRRFIACFDRRMEQEVTHPIFRYRISYRRLLEVQSRLLVRHLAGEIPRYPNFLTR
ncbi:MAG: CRISPR-associated endonuclease Cas1, partial [Thermodesulfobacteriota bacterium]